MIKIDGEFLNKIQCNNSFMGLFFLGYELVFGFSLEEYFLFVVDKLLWNHWLNQTTFNSGNMIEWADV